jgi:hypothetical protein
MTHQVLTKVISSPKMSPGIESSQEVLTTLKFIVKMKVSLHALTIQQVLE